MNRLSRVSLATVALTFLPLAAAVSCHDHDDGHAHGADDRCSGADPTAVLVPSVAGSDERFTDEGCRAFLDAEANGKVVTTPDGRSPTLTSPASGATLGAPATFAWTKGAAAASAPLERLRALVLPSAHAHGKMTGDGYVLIVKSAGAEALRVMTIETTWSADAGSLAILQKATGPLTATVVWGKYVDGALAAGSVPVASAAVPFAIAK